MWKPIFIDEKEFVLKTGVIESVHQISLTNFTNLWLEQITDGDLIQRCKRLNPLFEAKPNALVNHILSLLDTENPDIVRHMEESENEIILNLESRFESFKFLFQFKLQLQPAGLMYRELTLPMLLMITELQRRKKMLTSLLAKKDVEIAQYKLEGAELVRKNVKTEPFDEDKFNAKCLETISERRSEIEQHPAHVFTISNGILYQQVTAQPRQSTAENETNSALEPEMENTVQLILNEKKVTPQKRRKPKIVPVEPPVSVEVKVENNIKTEVIPAKRKKPRVLLKNL